MESDGEGYLVVRDNWTRSWRAAGDGPPARELRVNGRHRAVRVPEGRHQLRLWYEASGLGLGSGLSALSAGALGLLAVGLRRR